MTDHHHPESPSLEPATTSQQRYLRVLAQQTGQTCVPPKTRAEASAQIRRLKRAPQCTRTERLLDDRSVSHALATSTTTARRVPAPEFARPSRCGACGDLRDRGQQHAPADRPPAQGSFSAADLQLR